MKPKNIIAKFFGAFPIFVRRCKTFLCSATQDNDFYLTSAALDKDIYLTTEDCKNDCR